MDSLHVHRFRARHEVADDESRRLAQAAQASLLDGELEGALAQAVGRGLGQGLGQGDEIVLLRRLSSRVRLHAGRSERDNARLWGDALAQGLAQALQHGGDDEVIRFAHRGQVIAAFAADAVHGVDQRDWAWQRLGLLPATRERRNSPAQRRAALLRCLADDATHSVPLLRSLQAGALWGPLLRHLHDGELRGIVQATLAQLAGHDAMPFIATLVERAAGAANLVVLPASVAATAGLAGPPARTVWALRLVAMLLQPALARRGARAVDALVAQWMQALRIEQASSRRSDSATLAAGAAGTGDTGDTGGTGDTGDTGFTGGTVAPIASVAMAAKAHMPDPARVSDGHVEQGAAHGVPTDRSARPPPAASPRPQPAQDPGRTAHGGLLLLTPLLPACGALALLEDPAVWPTAALPQVLHALARQLALLRDDDPAALAFCGLAPLSPPPPRLQVSPAQATALQDAQSLIEAELARRLPDWCGPGLLQRVLARPARITADPGWIEVNFRLRDVAVEIRRAALDLDPGFVPWLGAVLRYRYE